MENKVGRPRVRPLELLTLDEAVEFIHKTLLDKYKSEEIAKRMSLAKGTIYNLISQKKLRRHGKPKCALVEKMEILKLIA